MAHNDGFEYVIAAPGVVAYTQHSVLVSVAEGVSAVKMMCAIEILWSMLVVDFRSLFR